jgi:hypothetical protein
MFRARTLPSYRFTSYSGIPSPKRPPMIPPVAPSTAAPLSAAMIDPAATHGATPGMANAQSPRAGPRRHRHSPCVRQRRICEAPSTTQFEECLDRS